MWATSQAPLGLAGSPLPVLLGTHAPVKLQPGTCPTPQVHSEVDGWARVIRLSDNRTGLVPSWAVALE